MTRQIHEAHLSLLEPTPESRLSGEQYGSASQRNSDASSAKEKEKKTRRATTEGLKREKKVAKTCATKTSPDDIFDFRGSSDGELDIVPRKRRKLEELPTSGATLASAVAAKPNRNAVAKDSYASHENDATNTTPSKLRSYTEQSNNRLSSPEDMRSRISEQPQSPKLDLKDKARLLIGVQDLMPPSPLQQLGASHSQISPTSTIPFTTPGDSQQIASRMQAERLASLHSSARGKAPTASTGFVENPMGTFPGKGQAVGEALSARMINLHARRPSIPDDPHLHAEVETEERALINTEDVDRDELSISQQSEVQASRTRPLDKNNHHHQPDELGSDDMGIGLPKEQYQPRPSRSRSSRANKNLVIPENFSKRPETLIRAKAKAKNKRRKTTGGEKYLHEDVEIDEMYSQKREWDADESPKKESSPAKTPAKRRKATPENQEVEVRNDIDVAARPSEAKKKRGRPRKSIEVVEDAGIVEIREEPENESPERSKHTKTTASNKSRKLKKADEPSHLIEDHSDLEDTVVLDTHKNQSRPDEATTNALSETQANALPPETPTLPPPATSTGFAKEKTPSPTRPQLPAQTPQKPTEKGPDKHSPLNRGKISYRVGLSKRARIAPLLRIVGK